MPRPFSRSSSSGSRDSNNRLVSSRCPECGAPVDFRNVPRDQAQVKCAYCGTLIAIPGRAKPHVETAPVVTSNRSVTQGSSGCGVVGWAVLILIGGLALIGGWSTTMITTTTQLVSEAIRHDTSTEVTEGTTVTERRARPFAEISLAPKPRLATAPVILGGNENTATQMVIAAYQSDGSLLIGFDPVRRTETWRSPLLSDKYYEMGVSADAARVYVADGAKLMALDRGTGKTHWQTSLANNIQTACSPNKPCLQQVGDQIVALSRDGTVQGFAGDTGAPQWSRRLNRQPREFLVNNEQVILIDQDDGNRAVVLVLNGRNGDLIHELQPSCTFPNITMRPHASDQYVITPDGSALIIVSSGIYACAWRYRLDDGTLTWHYTPANTNTPLPFTWSMSSLVVSDPMIYFIKDESDTALIYALDSQLDGAAPQPLYSVKEYDLTLEYALGTLLLVSATPDFARDEVELWAIDRNSGERRWQRKLETTHSFDDWVTRPTDQGIFVAVCSWHDDDCRFEVLDLTTGASKGQVRETAAKHYSGAAWRGNQGFLTIDGKLYAIDLRTAEVQYTWP